MSGEKGGVRVWSGREKSEWGVIERSESRERLGNEE